MEVIGMNVDAMKQALEALENVRSYDKGNLYGLDENITALNAAIAEAEKQEPVADGLIRRYINALVANKPDEAADATKRMVDYVFATPPAAQRQWVGLTDTQIEQVYFETVKKHRGAPMPWGQVQFGKALEAKLKERNT
jgi:hypothetical protein